MESWYTGTGTPPRHCAATWAQYRRGRLSPMTDSRSPRPKPRAARPRARSRTSSWYWRQVQVCQIPRSFSRMAGRFPSSRALRCSRRGSVVRSATLPSVGRALDFPQIGLDYLRVRSHLGGSAFRDFLPHVEDCDPVGDIHDHAHVVLDQDDGRAPLLVHVEDEGGHVLLLLGVAAAHRLVEQQDLRIERDGPAQLDALLEPIGQRAGRPPAQILDPEEVDVVLNAARGGELFQGGVH